MRIWNWVKIHVLVLALKVKIIPESAVYADRLTELGRVLSRNLIFGVAAVAALVATIVLLKPDSWTDVLAGALLAWGVSGLLWARSNYAATRDARRDFMRQQVEIDLLHARLNHLAAASGAPLLGLSSEISAVQDARAERLAHFMGYEDVRAGIEVTRRGALWWDSTALGIKDDEPA